MLFEAVALHFIRAPTIDVHIGTLRRQVDYGETMLIHTVRAWDSYFLRLIEVLSNGEIPVGNHVGHGACRDLVMFSALIYGQTPEPGQQRVDASCRTPSTE